MEKLVDSGKTAKLLAKYKFPLSKQEIISRTRDSEAIKKAAKKVGFPVAVKGMSNKIVHKTDAGVVKTDIKNEEELEKACNDIISAAKKAKAKLDSILVQKMETGKEVIVGMKRDKTFGSVILFGLGGIFVEVMKDVSFRVPPLSKEECYEMVREIKGFPVLEGVRGEKAVNIDKIVDILMKVSSLSQKEEYISEMDLNPIIVNQKKAVVVDARIITEK